MDKKAGWIGPGGPWTIFICFFLVRLAFILFSGYNNYALQEDSSWYVGYADAWLRGDFNFDIGRFILSPGYVWFIAFNKLFLGDYWETGIVAIQLLIASLSGVYFYKLARSLFDAAVAGVATVLFCFLPLTFWWVHTFTAEILFQSLLIISLYFLVLASQTEKVKPLVFSAFLFGAMLLLKSHIILFTPFIVLYYYFNGKNSRVKFVFPVIFGAICILCLSPFSIYCWNNHKALVLSSNGSGYQFYLGNTEVGYTTVVDPPDQGTEDFKKLQDVIVYAGYFNGNPKRYDSILQLPQSVKQKIFTQEAMAWIKANPGKWMTLKLYDLVSFLKPGVSYKYYDFKIWLIALIVYLPVYLLAYWGIYYSAREKGWRSQLLVIGLFVTMLFFSVIWYVQNRFRTITIEPFYILYAAFAMVMILRKWKPAKSYFTSS